MPVILINKTKRMLNYNLDSTEMIGLRGKKQTMHKRELRSDGSYGARRIQKMVCGSLTLCAGERTAKFPDGTPFTKAILKVAGIATDIRSGKLQSSSADEDPAAVAAVAAVAVEEVMAAAEYEGEDDNQDAQE